MSSAKLSGLSAHAGSGSDDDNEEEKRASSPGKRRSVVVAIEKTEDGLAAVRFAAENVLKGEVREGRGFEQKRWRKKGKGSIRIEFLFFSTSTSGLVACSSPSSSPSPPPSPPLCRRSLSLQNFTIKQTNNDRVTPYT